ncbi:MAG: SAM-dependent chlorinase/fluorinase [Hydrogenobacter thermophilus]|uniref:SAM hydrolase/SAM-dependent halogenase family protein n=1 Tax=Hydrogenobacter thermophilus TaxID=940 RepID=UPI001C76E40C|nr:SAM-dependent chlorinase/fluorinase [Hydrogenobacter thermophilus]QWK19201.1 MAG: SAM-dependent chlorinase/fluorinase [Hydrogenobacter thermophilus]
MRPIVALLTDFGTKDGFVGAMKGVMLSINPDLQIVDITHNIEPFNILKGALILRAHYRYFPKGTIFLCVVDPGVGSEREPLAIECGKYTFVGPHNGIFDLVLKDISMDILAYKIERYTLPRWNETFHGRDVFAPICAYLSTGLPLHEVGRSFEYNYMLKWEDPLSDGKKVKGKIIYFDRFGNCVTNVPCGNFTMGEFRGEKLRVVSHFLQQKVKKPALLCGSFGFMELFIPLDSAKDKLKVSLGEEIIFYLP